MYYLLLNDAQTGPFTMHQIRSMWNAGQINATTNYWQEGLEGWEPLAAILSSIEAPQSDARPVSSPPAAAPSGLNALSLGLIYQRLLYGIVVLSFVAFFLPNISITMPIVGTMNESMLDLVTSSSPKTHYDTTVADVDNGSQHKPNIWDAIDPKEGVGGIICAIAVFLQLLHYGLTLVWSFSQFVLKRQHQLVTYLWLGLAVQFPVLFLIGGQMLIGGMRSKMSSDLAGNPFSEFGQALASSIKVQPGLVTWFLMLGGLCAFILYKSIVKNNRDVAGNA